MKRYTSIFILVIAISPLIFLPQHTQAQTVEMQLEIHIVRITDDHDTGFQGPAGEIFMRIFVNDTQTIRLPDDAPYVSISDDETSLWAVDYKASYNLGTADTLENQVVTNPSHAEIIFSLYPKSDPPITTSPDSETSAISEPENQTITIDPVRIVLVLTGAIIIFMLRNRIGKR